MIDLVALRKPQSIRFPNDKEFRVEPFRGPGQALLRQYRAEQDTVRRGELLIELLRLAVPDATEDDWASVSMEDWAHILGAANGATALVEHALKNAPSGDVRNANAEASSLSTSPPSTTTTKSPASSPRSRKRTAKNGATSTRTIGTAP